MGDDAFSFETALAARKLEEAAQRERGQRLYEWGRETHTDTYVRVRRVSREIEDTLHQFLGKGGRIGADRTVWIPSDHPYDTDIVLDEGCIVSPPLPEFVSADTYPAARMRWEKERSKIRSEVTAGWDAKYPRAAAMNFGYWEQEGPHETIWIFVDGQGAGWTFGSGWPELDRVRRVLVEALFRQNPSNLG
ncbi:hypothetical protein B1A87_007705 [Arthrobacter sp. KBS0703]|uniref:hypothetical protein n=1 Tax=Arthrobacter sp. KBS0703 TaxID=1955698 RepID=UPI00098EA3AA|nr:hypothetical protein [Arthrobacter sp. KBS0703]TSE15801.1 hypothetical protein B1A87_007705 [Arthrobacter sp. KBS0703]